MTPKLRIRDTRIVHAWLLSTHRGRKPNVYNVVDKIDGRHVFGPAPWHECVAWRKENLA